MIRHTRQFLWGMTVVLKKKNMLICEGSLNAKK
mgnify:CR=1 FL=1|jgi:hypothetical protein